MLVVSVAFVLRIAPQIRTSVLLIAALLGYAHTASANPLRIDLDRDGIRDIVWITHGPVRPGLSLWLSSTQQFTRLRSRSAIRTVMAADLDRDGQLDLVASIGARSSRLQVWKNVGGGFLEPLRRPRHPRKVRLARHHRGRVADLPENPPSTVASRIFEHVVTASELSYFPLHLTLVGGAIPVSHDALASSHALPRSPRAPPLPHAM